MSQNEFHFNLIQKISFKNGWFFLTPRSGIPVRQKLWTTPRCLPSALCLPFTALRSHSSSIFSSNCFMMYERVTSMNAIKLDVPATDLSAPQEATEAAEEPPEAAAAWGHF
jgi:hypothetical protein